MKQRHKAFSDQEKEEMQKLYTQGKSVRAIAKILGRSAGTIYPALERLGVNFRKHVKVSDTDKQKILELYRGGATYDEIAPVFGISKANVCLLLQALKEPIRAKKWMQKYTLDETFFEKIDTEEKAYWLGFMFADGNVDQSKRMFRVMLADLDREHLVRFRDSLKSTAPIVFEKEKQYLSYKSHSRVSIKFGSQKMCQDLGSHGCVPAKSLIIQFPTTVPDNLMYHFTRGLFDGDGSITNGHNRQFRIVGALHLMAGINNYIAREVGIGKTALRSQGKVYELSHGGTNTVLKIYDWLYKDATIWLPRKRQVFEDIKAGVDNGYT